ncbi:protein tyrosine phosphatase non-receptor type 5 [Phyllostomus discolor]|uniref:protein-tyrosine-phosphatase n=1 Tax=Phyllostomus discolor TaxID=89673 RepID=A0A833ZZ83_9CHIR|nr:protein tyrosine phosphatase non-receptor type 5 [Phyllostomus discolor]
MYVAGGSLGRAVSWLLVVSFPPKRALRPPLGTQHLGPSPHDAVRTLGAQVEVSSLGRETGAKSPGSELNPLSQLACGMLWLSGYGPVWLQNATLLEQLGPAAWLGVGTWDIPSLLLVSVSVLLVTTLVWHLLRAPPEPPTPEPPEDRRQSVSRQPSFTYSEWMEEKIEDDFLDLDPVPETPVFDCTMDIKPEADPASLTVKSMGLQERRGSNVSLTLDMCTPGCNEEGFGYLMSPREESAREYLLSASRVLQAEELHEKALDPFLLQAEFFEIPMNFVDPKEYDIPGLVRKNRYKTILPSKYSLCRGEG